MTSFPHCIKLYHLPLPRLDLVPFSTPHYPAFLHGFLLILHPEMKCFPYKKTFLGLNHINKAKIHLPKTGLDFPWSPLPYTKNPAWSPG